MLNTGRGKRQLLVLLVVLEPAGTKLLPYASCCLWLAPPLAYCELPILDHDLIFGHAVKAEVPSGALPSTR